MAVSAFVPLALFVISVGSVGLRLASLGRRTRQVPEMSLGIGLLAVSLSMPLSAAGRIPAIALDPVGRVRVCFAAGLAAAVLGLCSMAFFNYRVFRRGSLWGRVGLGLICGPLVVAVAYISATNFRGASVDEIKRSMQPGTLSLLATVGLAFVWMACESLAYYAASRRQRALGLVDPVVTNRFLLWGVASAASSVSMAVIVACVLAGMTTMREPLPLAVMAASGTVMSTTWYLTFFVPQRYQRYIRARTPSSS